MPSPLLVTDQADELPEPLQFYLLNVQPGFLDDRREVAYSRAWVLGDEEALSVEAQVALDQVIDLVPVQASTP